MSAASHARKSRICSSFARRWSGTHSPRNRCAVRADLNHGVKPVTGGALDDVVRENLILEVPMKPLCSESCKGIEIPAHVRPPADFGVSDGQLETFQKLRQALPDASVPRKQE